jgi:hypothetical protein
MVFSMVPDRFAIRRGSAVLKGGQKTDAKGFILNFQNGDRFNGKPQLVTRNAQLVTRNRLPAARHL